MNQNKIGNFMKTLRRERNLTQEQLAEAFHVSRRTVSRWETGYNMPDLDILIEMSDFYDVDLREILDGERKSEKMNAEMKETVIKVAEYSNDQKRRIANVTLIYFILGIVSLIINQGMRFFDLPETFFVGLIEGITAGTALVSMIFGILYVSDAMANVQEFKKRVFGRTNPAKEK